LPVIVLYVVLSVPLPRSTKSKMTHLTFKGLQAH
jgi:hypothetical protein